MLGLVLVDDVPKTAVLGDATSDVLRVVAWRLVLRNVRCFQIAVYLQFSPRREGKPIVELPPLLALLLLNQGWTSPVPRYLVEPIFDEEAGPLTLKRVWP